MGFKHKKDDNKYYLQVELDTDYEVITEPEGDWDRGVVKYTLINVMAIRKDAINYDEGLYFEENVPKPGETVYVLIERYDDGDTFGEQKNCYEYHSWHRTSEEAHKAQDRVYKCGDGYFSKHHEFIVRPVVVS